MNNKKIADLIVQSLNSCRHTYETRTNWSDKILTLLDDNKLMTTNEIYESIGLFSKHTTYEKLRTMRDHEEIKALRLGGVYYYYIPGKLPVGLDIEVNRINALVKSDNYDEEKTEFIRRVNELLGVS